MPKEKPLDSFDDWDRFKRDQLRAKYAITNREFFSFVAVWAFGMLMAHLFGAF